MNSLNKVELFQTFQLVRVRYFCGESTVLSEKEYTYKAPLELELKVDDYAVVKPNRYTVVKVTAVDVGPCPTLANGKHGWIVDKVDKEGHDARLEREREMERVILTVESKRERQRLRQEIESYLTNEQRTLLSLPLVVETAVETITAVAAEAGPKE